MRCPKQVFASFDNAQRNASMTMTAQWNGKRELVPQQCERCGKWHLHWRKRS